MSYGIWWKEQKSLGIFQTAQNMKALTGKQGNKTNKQSSRVTEVTLNDTVMLLRSSTTHTASTSVIRRDGNNWQRQDLA